MKQLFFLTCIVGIVGVGALLFCLPDPSLPSEVPLRSGDQGLGGTVDSNVKDKGKAASRVPEERDAIVATPPAARLNEARKLFDANAPKKRVVPVHGDPIVWRIGAQDDGKTARQALAAEVSRWLNGRLSPIAVEAYIVCDAGEKHVRSALNALKNRRDELNIAALRAHAAAVEDKKAKGKFETYEGTLVEDAKGNKYYQWPSGCDKPSAYGQRVDVWTDGKDMHVLRINPREYPQLDRANEAVRKEALQFQEMIMAFLLDAPLT